MPATPHQRIQVITIKPVRSALERISAATGTPLGGIVREMLEEMLPGLEAMADALELVPKSPGEALARMAKGLDEAVSNAKQISLDLEPSKPTLVQRRTRKALKNRRADWRSVTE